MKTVAGGKRKLGLVLAFAGAVMAPGSARAGCSSANQYMLDFSSYASTTLNYASTYSYTATSSALGSQAVTVGFQADGLASSSVSGIQLPALSDLVTGGSSWRNLVIGGVFAGRTTSLGGATRVIVTTLTFPVPIRDFSIMLNDVDYLSNQFRDWVRIVGVNGAQTYIPVMTTPYSNNNTGGSTTDANSSVQFGPNASSPVLTASEAAGIALGDNNMPTGTLYADFPQPVTQVQIRYGNYPLVSGETSTGQQAFGIQSIIYCPMPELTVTKSSASVEMGAADPKRFNIPGADIAYSLTVSNSNSSPVDIGSMQLTDLLPATLTFYNGDIDGTGPLTTNFEFSAGTSGLTFSSANLAYSTMADRPTPICPLRGMTVMSTGCASARKARWRPIQASRSAFAPRSNKHHQVPKSPGGWLVVRSGREGRRQP